MVDDGFYRALAEAGIQAMDTIIADGMLHRFRVTEDPPGTKNAWYVYHPDPPAAGAFGCWKRGIDERWRSDTSHPPSPEVNARWRAMDQARRQEENLLATEASERGKALWEKALASPDDHPYLQAKAVQAHDIRALPPSQHYMEPSLVVPLRDIEGQLTTIQFIHADGTKRFLSHGRKSGSFHIIGQPGDIIFICEGYATGATIYEATGHLVAVAFDTGNLIYVARALKAKHPDRQIIICGDNDQFTEGNPGKTKAEQAAQDIGARVVLPEFKSTESRPTDFNDLAHLEGLNAVRSQIEGQPCLSPSENRIRMLEIDDFLQLELPPREQILAPWLPVQGLTMVYAPRGIGKTFFALYAAYAIASGDHFLNWYAPKPRGVLYIDGEMPASVLQERLLEIFAAGGHKVEAPLKIYTPDIQEGAMIDLACFDDQGELLPFLEGIDLVIVDNISTLCRTGKENESDSWLSTQQWALGLRARGISVLFIHHANKGGSQRGTSRREDVLDTVIALKRPRSYSPDEGAVFEVHFEKSRGFYGTEADPLEARLATDEDGRQAWTYRSLDQSTFEKVLRLTEEGLEPNEIAKELEIHKSTVSRHLKKARQEGLLKGKS